MATPDLLSLEKHHISSFPVLLLARLDFIRCSALSNVITQFAVLSTNIELCIFASSLSNRYLISYCLFRKRIYRSLRLIILGPRMFDKLRGILSVPCLSSGQISAQLKLVG